MIAALFKEHKKVSAYEQQLVKWVLESIPTIASGRSNKKHVTNYQGEINVIRPWVQMNNGESIALLITSDGFLVQKQKWQINDDNKFRKRKSR